ncbi:MAG: hypothetical protein JOZ57_07095, partial [Abitibacteriaceae bacterium]|nr:hypothetical protein [Abditibacteriaceae bacterium]
MKFFRFGCWLLVWTLFALPALSAPDRATWSARLEPAEVRAGESAQVVVVAKLEAPWHVYSTTQPKGGPIKTTINLLSPSPLIATGAVVQPPPIQQLDPGFHITVEFYEGAVAFGIPVKVVAGQSGAQKATVQVRFMMCKEGLCLAPKTITLPVSFTIASGAARPDHLAAITSVPPQPPGAKNGVGAATSAADNPDLFSSGAATGSGAQSTPPNSEGDIAHRVQSAQNAGLGPFLWCALSAGFLALLTPCVFPMIPITVSFFAKQQEGAGASRIAGPVAYCCGIIGTFTGIGLLISAIFGASGITKFAANPWINLGMAALFILLALNLFGVYEVVVPPALLSRIQPQRIDTSPGAKRRGNLAAPMLMGLAFTLTSFTCTVPFVGTLLVATAKGGALWPFLGMLAFSTAFASPFFLLALFPQWLARLPKAGSWLVSVKAYMGFLELAAALKFLSNADYVWQKGWLTRPVFLSVWSTLALVASFYLLRWLRLPHDADTSKPGIFRRTLGVATAGVGIYLLATIGGASLGEFDAYLPPRDYGIGGAYAATVSGQPGSVQWIK